MTRLASCCLLALAVLLGPACAFDDVVAPPAPGAVDVTPTGSARDDLLAGADSVVMDVVFSGCFHHSEHRLALIPDSLGARTQLSTAETNVMFGAPLEYVAPSHLDLAQLHGLTLLLAYYRAGESEWMCTNSVTLDVTTYRDGGVVRREHFVDATCGGGVAGLLHLGEVIQLDRTQG